MYINKIYLILQFSCMKLKQLGTFQVGTTKNRTLGYAKVDFSSFLQSNCNYGFLSYQSLVDEISTVLYNCSTTSTTSSLNSLQHLTVRT